MLNYGQSISVYGNKGTGKTNLLAFFFMLTQKRVIFWDNTNKPQITNIADITIDLKDLKDKLPKALFDSRIMKIKIRIPREILGKKKILTNEWDKFNEIISNYEDIYFTKWQEKNGLKKDIDFTPRKNLVIINDEIMICTEEFKRIPEAFNTNLIVGGNEALSFISAFQRHANIPKTLSVLSEIKIIFRIDDYDVYALTGKVHDIDKSLDLPPYHFFVYNASTGQQNWFKPVPLLLENRFIKTRA